MKTKLNIDLNTLILVVVGVLLLLNLFKTNNVKTDVESYRRAIDSLKVKVDSVTKVNLEINKKISGFDNNILSITNEIKQVDKNILIIKKQTNEKVNSVDSLSSNELELFFTNRYK